MSTKEDRIALQLRFAHAIDPRLHRPQPRAATSITTRSTRATRRDRTRGWSAAERCSVHARQKKLHKFGSMHAQRAIAIERDTLWATVRS